MNEAVAGAPVSDVIFEEKRILVLLEDRRLLAAPFSWVGPTVAAMSPAERLAWARTPNGRGVNWPAAGQTSDDGALNVWSLEQDALFEEALAEIDATSTADALRDFWSVVGPIAESDEVSTMDDVYSSARTH